MTELYSEDVTAISNKERDAKFVATAKLVSEDTPADQLFDYRITTATTKGVEGFPFDLDQTILPPYNATYTRQSVTAMSSLSEGTHYQSK